MIPEKNSKRTRRTETFPGETCLSSRRWRDKLKSNVLRIHKYDGSAQFLSRLWPSGTGLRWIGTMVWQKMFNLMGLRQVFKPIVIDMLVTSGLFLSAIELYEFPCSIG